MGRPGPVAALTAILCLAGCAPAGTKGAAATGDVEVHTTLDLSSTQPREGELATVVFRIVNRSSNYVVLRDLTYLADPQMKESASAAASWQFGMAGKLTYNPDANEWAHDRSKKLDRTAAVFNSGLLVPSEEITVRTRIRLLAMPKYFQLLYFELPIEKIRTDVYFEARQDREVRFRAMIGQDLRDRLVPDPVTDKGGHRTVLFPFAERVQPNASIKPLKVEAELRPREFSLAAAVKKSGGAAVDQYTFCASLEAWILKRGKDFTLVTPSSAAPLPLLRQMDRTFYFIDTQGVGRLEIQLQNDQVASVMQLEKKYMVVRDKQPTETRYCIFLRATELPKFFEDVRSSSMAVDVEMTADGGGRLLVIR